MSKFTQTLIAAALAVAVAGPAAADVKENGDFVGTNTTIKINPNGCKNDKTDVAQTQLRLHSDSTYRESGEWVLTGYDLGDSEFVLGEYIERKVGKDLTASLHAQDLGDCGTAGDPPTQSCFGVVGAIRDYIASSSCGGSMTDAQAGAFTVTKGNIKLSKSGERAKVDMRVEGEYTDDKGNVRKVKASIKGSKMDFSPDT